MTMPRIDPAPPGTQPPSWVPRPGDQGMPPAQPQPQPQPWQGPTPGWGPPTTPPVSPQMPQDYGSGYPSSMIPPAPARPGAQPAPFAAQPFQAPLPQQPGVPAQQMGQQPQQVPQQQVPGQPGRVSDLSSVLDGPNVPVEIRGRTLGEAIATYAGLRNIVMQNMYGPGLPSATVPQTPASQPTPAAQPQQPQSQPGTPTQPQWDWRNPGPAIRQQVEQVVQDTIMPALVPLHQRNMLEGINGARQQIAQELGVQNYAQLEPDILGLLQGVDPRALVNPQTWRVAAASAIGFRQMRGSSTVPAQNGGYAPQQVPPGQNPAPNLNSFFTERPGATARQDTQPQQLTAMELYVAQQMGKSPQDYMAWKGGIAR